MLQNGNSKLGRAMHCYSIPARITCPGRSAACEAVCYADDGFYNMPNVQLSLSNNLKASRSASFVADMVEEIRRLRVEILRVHVAGDYYSAAYTRKWIAIAKQCPNVKFFAYTRSWRVPTIMPALTDLAALPNVILWWSTDKDTVTESGAPPALPGVRVAYLQSDPDEAIPAHTDLVFRDKHDTLAKYIDGRLVCPAENGTTYNENFGKMTCSKCQLCLNRRAVPRKETATV